MKGSEQSHSVSSGTIPDPQDLERNIQLAGTGLPFTSPDEGIRKSQPLLEGITTDPKDSGGNIQPADKGLPSTASNEGTDKTTSHPKGPLGDKDLGGNKTPPDMEPINPTIVDPSGTEHQSPSPNKDKPEPSHTPETQESDSDSLSPDLKKFDNTSLITERQLVKYLRKATMDSLEKTTTDRINLLKDLNEVIETLKVVQDAVKDDPALNKKVIEATEAYTKNTTTFTKLLSLGENDIQADIEEPPSHTEGEHVAMEDDTKKPESDKAKEEPINVVPISIVRPITRPNPQVALIESLSRPPLTDPILQIRLTKEQIQAYMNREEQITKAAKEAKMFKMTKTEVIKVVQEEAEKIGLDPKKIISAKAGEKNNDKKNFDVHSPFKFGDFRIIDLDELGPIIEKKKNSIIKELMTSLGKRYERLEKIPEELGIQSALPAPIPEQATS
ncbi:hypothetical protein Tco_0051692 [Tanacetum coccineum]